MFANIYTSVDFFDMDSAYWGLGSIRANIFFALCTHNPNKSATLFSFDKKNKKINKIFTLSEIIPPKEGELPQGKIHTPIFEGVDGNLYFGTHFAYPFGKPQSIQYEGGHLISYNFKTKSLQDIGIPVKNEGIITLAFDKKNMILYGLTAPSFIFFSYDISNKRYVNFGKITRKGSICRALVVDDNGNTYGSFEKNNIFRYNKRSSQIEYLKTKLPGSDVQINEWQGKYRGGVNYIGRKIWRSALWHKKTKKIFGIQAEESHLFSFNPQNNNMRKLDFLGDDDCSKRLNQVYPTLSLACYQDSLFYTPVNGFFDYCRSENIMGYPSLISYNVLKNKKINHGKIKTSNRKVFGVAGSTMTKNGVYYLLGAVEVLPNEVYNKFNTINKKGFYLGLIEINTKQLQYA